MKKRLFRLALALITVIMLTALSSCTEKNTAEASTVPPRPTGTEEIQMPPETIPETEPEIKPETEPEVKPETEPEVKPETEPEVKPETEQGTELEQPSHASTTTHTETAAPILPTASSLTEQSFKTSDGLSLGYWLYTPEDATDNMPLLIYLHGGSGKGDELDILLQNGFPQFLSAGLLGNIPAYIIIPQVSNGMKGWTDIKNPVRELVYYCCNTYGTDLNRVSLTGHSMGGTGTWKLALAFPSLFSCIAPMSGSITTNDDNVSALSGMPVWAFVGSADKIVNPESSIQFIDALKKVNDNAQITVFDGADHIAVPSLAYLDYEINVIQWMITQSK